MQKEQRPLLSPNPPKPPHAFPIRPCDLGMSWDCRSHLVSAACPHRHLRTKARRVLRSEGFETSRPRPRFMGFDNIRRGDDHLARAALLAGVRDFTSGRMGPWNSHLKWLYDMACKISCVAHPWSFIPANIKQIADQLQVWAENRSSWKDKAQYFQNLTLLPCTFCVSTSWQHWRDPLRHDVAGVRVHLQKGF